MRSPAWLAPVDHFLHAAVLDPAKEAPADRQEDGRRRTIVCALTVVLGAAALWWSLSTPAGDPLFYPATLLLAAIWVVGARASGPVVPRRVRPSHDTTPDHDVVHSLILGTALLLLFLAGAAIVSHVPFLERPVQQLLDHARYGSLAVVAVVTAINGLSEEYFFRGALFQALPKRWRVVASTVVYAVVTSFSGVPLLVLAAVMLGALVGMQRRASGGFLAPTITHLVWSLGMLFLLPPTLDALG